jgi:uncharacterized membrane protein
MSQDGTYLIRKQLADLARLRPQVAHVPLPVRNINVEIEKRLTVGQRTADAVANGMGSWRFILIQSGLLAIWIFLNVVAWISHWDAYPFILLNLVMSFQAAYAAPIIMMSQNRQSQKDRLAADHDYQINLKAEEEIKGILMHLEYQDDLILQVLERLEERAGASN